MDKFRVQLKAKLNRINEKLDNINKFQIEINTRRETLLDVRHDLEQLIESYDEANKSVEGEAK